MMSRFLQLARLVLVWALVSVASAAHALEQESRNVTLIYPDLELLQDFNSRLELNSKLERAVRQKNVITALDEVMAKVEIIVEKVQVVLDMFPDSYHIRLVLLPTSADVDAVYKQKYGKDVTDIAYYSLSEKTIYLSVADTRLRVLAHEIGHSVVDYYFKQVRPPYNIHELMAQFAEQHVTD